MPSGRTDIISPIMSAISNRHNSHARIKSILEVGIGWGKWGVLFREYLGKLDIMRTEDHWELRLDCVEICQQYIASFKVNLYNHIYPMDVRDFCKEIETWAEGWTWDLITLIEVLEHMPIEDGHFVLKTLLPYAHWIVLSTPNRMVKQPVQFFHPNEQHVSLWTIDDFREYDIDEVIMDQDLRGTLALVLKGGRWVERPPKR